MGKRERGIGGDKFALFVGGFLAPLLLLGAIVGSTSKRKREIEALRSSSEAEVDQLHAEYVAELDDPESLARTAVYARFSTDKQNSVADQVRACLAFARENELYVPRELIFTDYAITGRKENRPGLSQMRDALNRREATTLLVLSTSRLFRGLVPCMRFVDDHVVAQGLRFVAIDRGLDTSNEHVWKLLLQLLGIMDELSATFYQGNIRAAHMARAQRLEVWGTLSFGYRQSADEDRHETPRQQRRRYEIDPEAATWVRQVFKWFAVDGISISSITRKLAATPNIPVPPKSLTGEWSRPLVYRMLQNRRYIGDWSYGWTDRSWNTTKDRIIQKRRTEPKLRVVSEELRIVDDALWNAAQERLLRNKGDRGRKNSDGRRNPATFLLRGLLYCKVHDRLMYQGGPKRRCYYRCLSCEPFDSQTRPLFTFCDGARAVDCLFRALLDSLRESDELVAKVISACQDAVASHSAPNASEIQTLESAIQRLTNKIQFLVDNLGEGEEDLKESARMLRQMRAERIRFESQLRRLRDRESHPPHVPTESEVRALLDQMNLCIMRALADPDADEDTLVEARKVLRLFTGERVLLSQGGERKKYGGWLVAEFESPIIRHCSETFGGGAAANDVGVKYRVDIRGPDPNAEIGKEVVELRDQNKLSFKVIAKRLKTTRNRVSRLYYEYRPKTSGGAEENAAKQVRRPSQPPLHERIADEVMRLASHGKPLGEIGEQLQVSSTTITAAVQYWYQSRGQKPPDGRTFRRMAIRGELPSLPIPS